MSSNEAAAVATTASFTLFNNLPAEIRDTIWAEAIHPGGVENEPLVVFVILFNARTTPGTKFSDVLDIDFWKRSPCHPRFIVPRACREAWAVNLMLYPHSIKVYARDEEVCRSNGTFEIDRRKHPQVMRFHGARDNIFVSASQCKSPAEWRRGSISVVSPDAFKHTRKVIIQSLPSSKLRVIDDTSDLRWFERRLARLLPYFPSLQSLVQGVQDWPTLCDCIAAGGDRRMADDRVWICGKSIEKDPRFGLENIGEWIEESKYCGYPFGPNPVMPRTRDYHPHYLAPLARYIEAGWADERALLEQMGAAPELVQNGDRFVRCFTVVCRHCGWKHREVAEQEPVKLDSLQALSRGD